MLKNFLIENNFMDILTFLGLDYRVTSPITVYFVVPGVNMQKKSDKSDN